MDNKKIEDLLVFIVYGDSLSLPRSFAGVACDQTYSELIKQWYVRYMPGRRISLYNRAQGGTGIGLLLPLFQRDMGYFSGNEEKVLLLQCGLVDCAPRPLPLWLRNQISKLPGSIRDPIRLFLHNNRSKMYNMGFRFRVTSPSMFKAIYRRWILQAAKDFSRVYVFTIVPNAGKLDSHSPGLNESIRLYNGYIREIVNSIKTDNLFLIDVYNRMSQDPSKLEKFINQKDGHHLTFEGHKFLSEQIIEMEKTTT